MRMRRNVKEQEQRNIEAVGEEREVVSFLSKEKKWVAVVIMIAIVCGAILFLANKNGIMRSHVLLDNFFGRNRIGEGAEPGSDTFSLGSGETVGQSVDMSKWDMDRVNAVADTEGVYVPVPKGFVASGATGEHTVNTGFVIYEGDEPVDDLNAWNESCTRNQFVWVPVPDPTRVYEEIGTTGKKKAKLWDFNATGRTQIVNEDTDTRREPGIIKRTYDNKGYFLRNGKTQAYTKESTFRELSITFDNDVESIEKYGGFYIGRYETGNVSKEQPVLHRMNDNIASQNWYAMYTKMKNISTNESVEISMIWGCLWDETLQWFIDTEAKMQSEVASDSGSWGNYNGTTLEYTNKSGGISTKSGTSIIPTGSTERNKANNIYDMAGNVYDWTLEGDGARIRYFRGGCALDNNPACIRNASGPGNSLRSWRI